MSARRPLLSLIRPPRPAGQKHSRTTVKGVHEFIQTISVAEHHWVLEATGNYSALLVYLLSEAGITVSLENPLKIKNFARAMLSVTKTDEIDARLIALYGERMQPDPYKLRSDSILVLKQKRTVLRQLKKQLVATRNLKGSMEFFLLLTLNARKPSKRRLLSSRSKSRQWKRISLPWRKASTGAIWTCSPPSKASVLHWQPRLSWPQAGSPILIMPSNWPVIWACHLFTNSSVRQSMSKVTSTRTGIQTSEASSMWRLSRHSGVMPSARLVSTVCGLTASQARWRSLLSPTNL